MSDISPLHETFTSQEVGRIQRRDYAVYGAADDLMRAALANYPDLLYESDTKAATPDVTRLKNFSIDQSVVATDTKLGSAEQELQQMKAEAQADIAKLHLENKDGNVSVG